MTGETVAVGAGIGAGLAAAAFFSACEGALTRPSEPRQHAVAVGHLLAVTWTVALVWLALLPRDPAPPWWTTVLFVLVAGFLLHVAGEQIPKALAHARPAGWRRLAGRPLALWSGALLPFTAPVMMLGRMTRRAIGPPSGEREPITTRDIRFMVAETSARADMEAGERQMITSIFSFGDTTAREIMTPRTDVFALDAGTSIEDAIRQVGEAQHSRVPIHGGDLDEVLGFVDARDLLAVAHDLVPAPAGLGDLAREATVVPEGKKVDDLLRDLRGGAPLAVVIDEYGGTAGIVTLEDILEEMVGEIQDEYDEEAALVVPLADGSLRVDGRLDVDDFNDLTGSELPSEGGAETMGGLLARELGRVPEGGESTRVDGWQLHVESVDGHRVTAVRARRVDREEGAEA